MIRDIDLKMIAAYCDENDATLDAFMAEPAANGHFVIATFRHGQYATERVGYTDGVIDAFETEVQPDLAKALAAMDDMAGRSAKPLT